MSWFEGRIRNEFTNDSDARGLGRNKENKQTNRCASEADEKNDHKIKHLLVRSTR